MAYSLNLPQGQHGILVGMTGSGKTTLARRLMSARPYCIVIDNKHELRWKGFTITNSWRAALNGTHTIFRPDSLYDVDQLLYAIYQSGGWTCYVDEVYTLGRGSSNSFPQTFVQLLTRGRSRGISVFTGTQRPVLMPRFCFTEARHVFLFELGDEEDAKHVAKMVGDRRLGTQGLTGHDFVYYRREGKIAIRSRLGRDDL